MPRDDIATEKIVLGPMSMKQQCLQQFSETVTLTCLVICGGRVQGSWVNVVKTTSVNCICVRSAWQYELVVFVTVA